MTPVPLIIDTDLSVDVDDVGMLCLAHALADANEATILAVLHDAGTLHGVGAICKVDMQINDDSQYTGIFQPGKAAGMIRMGSALEVTDSSGMVPGIGVKVGLSDVDESGFVTFLTRIRSPTHTHKLTHHDHCPRCL